MTEADLPQILEIEGLSFPTPWTRSHFLHEVRENPYALNLVLKLDRRLVGYASLWILDDELKINNIAVHPDWRRRGLGGQLLGRVLQAGRARGCRLAMLEVRPSNAAALALYESYGFREVGRRKDYYPDTGEDGILMTAPLE